MYSRISVYWQKQEIHICKIHMRKKIICLSNSYFSCKKSLEHIYESNIRCRNTMVSSNLWWKILTFMRFIFYQIYWRRLFFRTCLNLQATEWNYCPPTFSLTWLTFISFNMFWDMKELVISSEDKPPFIELSSHDGIKLGY